VSAQQAPAVELHVISDSTGETAARLVLAVEAQFPEQEFVTVRHPRADSVADLQLAVERMKGRDAVAIYTIVEPRLRAAMRTLCRRAKIHYCDLLHQPLEAVAKVSGRAARMTPRARPPLDESYFRRIAAIEFAVKNDDGLGRNLAGAEIVLVGVSRTSKTPLSIYLGYLGWRTTNVPLVKGIEPPRQLFEIDPARIVGLTIDAERLAEIRSERIFLMGRDQDRSYASLNEIYEDLEHAAAIQKQLGCPVIDVSELSIEEIALRIIRAVERRSAAREAAR
jgi:[pyruvate, water dikinase]-phosphate phosphotransferase / [pyruvate, water dikinase] kinase